MKKYTKILFLGIGITALLASCDCKTCKKESEISVTVCKDKGTQDDYNNTISAYENFGYTCK